MGKAMRFWSMRSGRTALATRAGGVRTSPSSTEVGATYRLPAWMVGEQPREGAVDRRSDLAYRWSLDSLYMRRIGFGAGVGMTVVAFTCSLAMVLIDPASATHWAGAGASAGGGTGGVFLLLRFLRPVIDVPHDLESQPDGESVDAKGSQAP